MGRSNLISQTQSSDYRSAERLRCQRICACWLRSRRFLWMKKSRRRCSPSPAATGGFSKSCSTMSPARGSSCRPPRGRSACTKNSRRICICNRCVGLRKFSMPLPCWPEGSFIWLVRRTLPPQCGRPRSLRARRNKSPFAAGPPESLCG
jgi:hypothetical protein